jgi:hypothetical protein
MHVEHYAMQVYDSKVKYNFVPFDTKNTLQKFASNNLRYFTLLDVFSLGSFCKLEHSYVRIHF